MVLNIRSKNCSSTGVKNLPKIYSKHCSYINYTNFLHFTFLFMVNFVQNYKNFSKFEVQIQSSVVVPKLVRSNDRTSNDPIWGMTTELRESDDSQLRIRPPT